MAVSLTFQCQGQDTQRLKAIWQQLGPHSCPYHYNFHLHTRCSDGQMEPEQLIEQAVDLGLLGLAITDHHSILGYQRAQRWLNSFLSFNASAASPTLWTGVEITSDLAGTEVHILGYGFDPDHPALAPYLTGERPQQGDKMASKVIQTLHQAGGLVILAHPARYRQPASRLIPLAVQLGIDGVEAYYAYGNPKPWHSSPPQMEEICHFSDLYPLFRTCGTDSHGDSILYRL